MPMPPPREPFQGGPLAIVAVAAALLLVGLGAQGDSRSSALRFAASSWSGLVGDLRPQAAIGQRMLVVLNAPSLADHVRRSGGRASGSDERRWTAAALAAQKQLITNVAVQGVQLRPEFTFTRVLNGFSAAIDARAVALLERQEQVAGVYPVRSAYPALAEESLLAPGGALSERVHRLNLALSGFDGRGVKIALLDTGVDGGQPLLSGNVLEGIDLVGRDDSPEPEANPSDPGALERHGTEIAGLLVGKGGPSETTGVAPGASVLPIRVAGWQPDATGTWTLYARTDQIVAGLERAVDPNRDGDAHDAARVALVPLAEPYAGFADSPSARAVAGALALDMLVVVAAGNDGPAGPTYGSISGPGGAPAALTVGAADLRSTTHEVRVALRAGLRVVFDEAVPLAGAAAPSEPATLPLVALRARPRSTEEEAGNDLSGASLADFFDERGYSLVAGRAVLMSARRLPRSAVESAARAGATAVVLYGSRLPAGSLGLDQSVDIPVVSVPADAVEKLLADVRQGARAFVSIGTPEAAPNGGANRVAPFSSRGLAFGGRVKPDVAAPGVALLTAQPGVNEDGSPRYGSVNGSSAAAATVAGVAAVLAHARPELGARALKSLLVGSARRLADDSVSSQGAGVVDLGAAAAGELTVEPTTLGLGRVSGRGWKSRRVLVLRNVSSRPLRVSIRSRQHRGPAAAVVFSAEPDRLELRRGQTARVLVEARSAFFPAGAAPAEGSLVVAPGGGVPLRVPWIATFGRPPDGLLGALRLSAREFRPSDTAPAVLTFEAGRVLRSAVGTEVQPVPQLDVELWSAEREKLGVLTTLRDLLPGRFALGLTGRGPAGDRLAAGEYRLRLVAFPAGGGPPDRRSVTFAIK